MSKKPETVFSEKFYKAFNKRFGTKGFIENIQQVGKIGTPDYLGVLRGRAVAFELKVGNNKPSKLQAYKLGMWAQASGLCYIVHPDNMDDVLNDVDTRTS